MLGLLALLLLARYGEGIVGGEEADIPPEDDPVVVVYKDGHDARVYGVREQPSDYYAFRGIKYAEPPTGRFRFQRARRLRLDGDVNATAHGAPCPQRGPGGKGFIGEEDCLSLNVFTPELPGGEDERRPVLVWIHGGVWRSGSAAQYGARHLVDKKLVVVTIQYRLGSLGFLSTGSKQLPGNVGLLDMALALDWVHDYISYFAGDPDKVTLCGQDTGGVSAQLLAMTRRTKGLLGGVIALGGSALSAIAVDNDPMITSRGLANQNSCPTSPVLAMLRCLQEMRVERIISGDDAFTSMRLASVGSVGALASLLSAGPVVDGSDDRRFLRNVLLKPPSEQLQAGTFPAIPLLTGVTRNPTSTALLGGLREKVEHQIRTVPRFVESVIGGLVSSTAGLVANRSLDLANTITAGVLRLPTRQQATDVAESLKKIVEATADALFNLPALQSTKFWSKQAPAYFFSFDHEGKRKGGPLFLHNSPLTDGAKQNTGVGHGDDLLYMFDAQPLDGSSEQQYAGLDDPIDVRVRGMFTDMIAAFARTGVPEVKTEEGGSWPAFTEGSTGYVSLSANSKTSSGFRECEMALWSGLLQSASCQALGGVEAIGGIVGAPTKVLGSAGSILGQPLAGVAGNKPTNQAAATVKPQAKKTTPRSRLNIGLPFGG